VLVPLVAILLVASVPVAMPTMFTLNMALGSLALAKKGVVVTRLSASEDAAAMDVLCTDKTGTITMNKLFVEDQSALNGFRNSDVLLYGALASNEADQDPIDLAFLAAAAEADLSLDTYSQTEFVPFDPKTRMTEAAIQKSGEKFFVRKGSVNAVCSSCQMSDKDTSALKKSVEAFSSKGLRVIAVAKGDHRSRLQLVGFTGVADKIRESSHQTVNQIRDLGVSVKMLTGDSLPIAKNIAQHIGLGDKISTMPKTNETSLGSAIEDSDGIAEIYPEDKYTIVKTLQSSGHIIGMTGDGINDAPALKQAEVGIAVVNATDIAIHSDDRT
jgi:H+-transporting ATPase